MKKNSKDLYFKLKGFEQVENVRSRGKSNVDVSEIDTLSINTSGKITVPLSILKYYDLECEFFNISFNSNKQAAILFHNDKSIPGRKKIIRFKNRLNKEDSTAYLAIGPQLRALNYSWGPTRLKFESKAKRLLMINLKNLKLSKL